MAVEFGNQMKNLTKVLLLKYLLYMLEIVILHHVFLFKKNMLPENLNKICVHILTLLLTFPISELLTSANFRENIIRFYVKRKEIY